ncbi:Glycerol uptake/efflux facilitator protein [Cytospora mali]|uniref:Glycerol uptake/efflux facilitator protein n=1 Tax=Cytospora mali TaxID=578113 RepID=A0A194W0S7_CYTMA|nr:Glycerol uptake/efflux facilitator protein [Valsa mali]
MRSRIKQGAKRAGPGFLTKIPSGSERKPRTLSLLETTRGRLGLQPDITTRPGTHANLELNWWQRMRHVFREPILEFWGVLVMALIGGSVVAVTYLSDYKDGNWLTICFGWSAGMMFGIYVAGDSGAYLNPAITLTNCLFRGLPIRRWPSYALSQVLGAFCAHGLVYANYISAIDQYEGHDVRSIPPSSTSTASFFCTFPESFTPLGSRIFSEFIANFFVTFLIFGVRDENGADLKGGGFFVIAFFWLNFAMIAAFGWETGSPSNPARDLTGRTWLAILGYKNAWSAYDYYFWIPLFMPFIGCFCGALAYDIFIYTGDSPINNGAWNPKRWWNSIPKPRKGGKKRQADEENLEVKGGRDELELSSSDRINTDSGSQEPMSDMSTGSQGIQGDDWAQKTEPGRSETYEKKYDSKPSFKDTGRGWDEQPATGFFAEEQNDGYERHASKRRMRRDEKINPTEAQKIANENMTKTIEETHDMMMGKKPMQGVKMENDNKSTGYDS